MTSYLISRLNDLNSRADTCSLDELYSVLESALELAEDAITEVVATELAFDKILEPASDSNFYGDEGIK